MTWVMVWGRFNAERWRHGWQELFDTHMLVHNQREIKRIVVSAEGDGAFAVVDIDTLSDLQDLHAGRDAVEDDRADGGASILKTSSRDVTQTRHATTSAPGDAHSLE